MSASLSSPPKGALCPHFGACGGCATQDIPYEEQLQRKAAKVSAAIAAAGFSCELKTHPSPDVWYYRNKMEFSFGDVHPPEPGVTVRLGLKPKGRWYQVLSLEDCRLLSPETPALLRAVRAWAEEHSVLPYNSHKHAGILRHLVVREAKNAADRMLILVTAPGDIPRDPFLKAVAAVYPATTVLRGLNAKLADTAFCETLEIWTGPGHITERLSWPGRALSLRVSPQSFFQTNTRGAELLYGILRGWIGETRPQEALDLYCGGGGIALSVADMCGRVVGIEQNPAAVADARENAALNAVSNADFYAASVEDWLAVKGHAAQAVIVDPPRCGLHPRALKALLEHAPARLFYVSCNPAALSKDLAALTAGYLLKHAEMVDLFPHTEHVETAVWLERR